MLKKVLYVSPVWTNLKNYDLKNKIESGMPAFSEPLKLLLSREIKLDILWIRDATSPVLVDQFFNSQKEVFINTKSKLGLLFSILIVFFKTRKQIKKLQPDIIFCHGALSVGAIVAAKISNKKVVVRIYGTNKYKDELNRLGKFFFMIRYPLVFLSFYISTDALIATDDGSSSNEIFNSIGRAKEFHFLRNGYPEQSSTSIKRKSVLLCVGRIEHKKNQIKAINFFEEAAKSNKELKLKFIGEVSSVEYFEELKSAINSSPFRKKIEILGGIDKKKLFDLYKESDAILGFQNNSNFGNVVIEAISNGLLLFSYPEKVFDEINSKTKQKLIFTGKSETKLAQIFSTLSLEDKNNIRTQSRKALESIIPPWKKRSLLEISIILGDEGV